MKGYGAACLAALATCVAASAGTAQAVTLHAACGPHAGSLTTDEQYQTTGPFYIHIARGADRYLASHGGTFEGAPRFRHPREVPCSVAESVATTAMTAWEHWSTNTGVVRVSVAGATGLPHLGRFYCTGQSYQSSQFNSRTYETCTHKGTHVGTIAVQFVIYQVGF